MPTILGDMAAKSGEHDLILRDRGVDVFTWDRMIMGDRSGTPVRKGIRQPLLILEFQVCGSEAGVLSVQIFADGGPCQVMADITTETAC